MKLRHQNEIFEIETFQQKQETCQNLIVKLVNHIQ